MLRKFIGLFIAACIGFLGLAVLGAVYAYQELSRGSTSGNKAPIAEVLPKQTVKVYFGNTNLNPGVMDCQAVFAVTRQVSKTPAIGRASLVELLNGPTQAEKNGGYYTSINDGVKINSLTINNGTAYVDFDSQMEKAVGGSCRVAAIRSQITQTLLQFPTVQSVVISIDGRVEDILQP